MKRLSTVFLYSAGVVLAVAAVAKFISSFGNARILQHPDPILVIKYAHLLRVVGAVELIVAWFCFSAKRSRSAVSLIAWLSSCFLVYHLGLIWIHYGKPCKCLGNLTDALHVPPQLANSLMECLVAYLLIGSYSTLFYHWWERKNVAAGNSQSGMRKSEPLSGGQ